MDSIWRRFFSDKKQEERDEEQRQFLEEQRQRDEEQRQRDEEQRQRDKRMELLLRVIIQQNQKLIKLS